MPDETDKRSQRGVPPDGGAGSATSLYDALIQKIFLDGHRPGASEVPFDRADIPRAAASLDLPLPGNVGDVLYSYRYRRPFPPAILATQPEGRVIGSAGRSRYAFRLEPIVRIVPNLVAVKIPDATPEIVSAYALSDEQSLLAKVRYNRLIDIHLGQFASKPSADDRCRHRSDRRDLCRRGPSWTPVRGLRSGEGRN